MILARFGGSFWERFSILFGYIFRSYGTHAEIIGNHREKCATQVKADEKVIKPTRHMIRSSLSIYLSINLLFRRLIISCISATLERRSNTGEVAQKASHILTSLMDSPSICWISLSSLCKMEHLCLQPVANKRMQKPPNMHSKITKNDPKMVPTPLENWSQWGSGSHLGASFKAGCFQDLILGSLGSILELFWDQFGLILGIIFLMFF